MRRSAVKSASRTLEILELFSDERRPLRLNDIYQALGYPQSSTTNLLKSMVMMGYLNYNRTTRTYLPTNRVTSLGNWLMSFLYGQNSYEALLDELWRKTDETVVLATQNDLFIQYMAVRTPNHEFKVPPSEGTMRLLTDSSAGFALMSQMKNRTVDKLCRYVNYYELSAGSRVDPDQVLKELSWVRQVGYCYMPQRPTAEVSSIAFPLGEQVHGIPLAIGVGGLSERISKQKMKLVETIRDAIADFRHKQDRDLVAEAAE